ncbi:hypothetical protein [uncultured Jannaschia sp.]|uniref:hypothetical protein n=1 Tax=uncultured Jannaschia sp. TaxID=293347 RepID=UPI002639BD62|nr:hypothetical protein [uncultured Jannaschia sp.]
MVPANKILTVAYGTFSCTLEGFDDPFSTMTDIAEYFRDLAEGDRFFGAEPPTPDMATLRLIAEARANRTVDAQPEDGGVVLRPAALAADAPANEAPFADDTSDDTRDEAVAEAPIAVVAPVPVPEVAETPEPAQDDSAVAEAVADASDDQPEIPEVEAVATDEAPDAAPADAAPAKDEAAEDEAAEDGVAAKLARIRGMVDADRAAEDGYTEDEHADEIGATIVSDDIAAAFADTAPEDIAPETPAEETAEDEIVEDETAEDESGIAADVEAMLNDADDTEAEATPAIAETPDTDAEPPRARRIRVRRLRRAQAAAEAAEANDAAEPAEPELPEAEEADLMSELAAIEAELTRDATGPEVETASEDQAEMPEDDDNLPSLDDLDDSDLLAELAAIRAATTSEDAVSDTPEAEAEDAATETGAAEDEAPASAPDAIAASDETPEADTPAAEDEATESNADAIAAEADAETEDAAETDETDADEAEADHRAGDIRDAIDIEEIAIAPSKGYEPEVDETDAEPQAAAPDDRDMERLFAATDSRLSGEDTSRRHANISHLKAAVAARRADGPVEAAKSDDTGAYREDLANTVRPRRAARPAEGRTDRPQRPERPGPLVLVSEQRVEDAPAADPTPAAPVQPRRAARQTEAEAREAEMLRDAANGSSEAVASDAQDFEAFAADRGAVDLPEILQAAAVYSTKVMGHESFSRPRLLHLAAEAVDDLSREDGLRGFGQLLRDGTIRKISRGEFALGEDGRFGEKTTRRAG